MSKQKKIVRQFADGKKYELTYKGIVNEFGKKVKHSRWMSLEKNEKEMYDIKDYVCEIPLGEKDIDLATLSLQCFKEK